MTASTGDQDVVDLLTADHHEVLALVAQIPTADGARRRDMTDTVIAELMRHSVAEEMYVYPAMREHLTDGDSKVQHDIQEHQQLEEVMKDLEGLDAGDARFLEALEKSEHPISVTRLNIRKRAGENDSYGPVEIGVSAYDRNVPAPTPAPAGSADDAQGTK